MNLSGCATYYEYKNVYGNRIIILGDLHDAEPCSGFHDQSVYSLINNLSKERFHVFAETVQDYSKDQVRLLHYNRNTGMSRIINYLINSDKTVFHSADCRWVMSFDPQYQSYYTINDIHDNIQMTIDKAYSKLDSDLSTMIREFVSEVLPKKYLSYNPNWISRPEKISNVIMCDEYLLINLLSSLLKTENETHLIYFGAAHCENVKMFLDILGFKPDCQNSKTFSKFLYLKNEHPDKSFIDTWFRTACCVHDQEPKQYNQQVCSPMPNYYQIPRYHRVLLYYYPGNMTV